MVGLVSFTLKGQQRDEICYFVNTDQRPREMGPQAGVKIPSKAPTTEANSRSLGRKHYRALWTMHRRERLGNHTVSRQPGAPLLDSTANTATPSGKQAFTGAIHPQTRPYPNSIGFKSFQSKSKTPQK